MGFETKTIWGWLAAISLGITLFTVGIGLAQRIPKEDGLMTGTLQRMPKSGISPADLPDGDSEGAQGFTKFCTQCHVLPSPKMHSAQEWWPIVERMAFRMWIVQKIMKASTSSPSEEGGEKEVGWEGSGMMKYVAERKKEMKENVQVLTEDQKLKIRDYLTRHALEVLEEGELPAKASAEIDTFKKVCSRCHDLPNPKLFSAAEWGDILDRQKKNMKEMDISLMTPQEETEILKFLKTNAAS